MNHSKKGVKNIQAAAYNGARTVDILVSKTFSSILMNREKICVCPASSGHFLRLQMSANDHFARNK